MKSKLTHKEIKGVEVEFNMWTELHRDGETKTLKLEYTVQQDGSIQQDTFHHI
jgi:hypothetical protein